MSDSGHGLSLPEAVVSVVELFPGSTFSSLVATVHH